jgi:hypothetical protein
VLVVWDLAPFAVAVAVSEGVLGRAPKPAPPPHPRAARWREPG